MVAGPVRLCHLCPRLLLTVEGSQIDWQSNYIFLTSSLSLSFAPPRFEMFRWVQEQQLLHHRNITWRGVHICIYDAPYLSIRVFDLIGLLYGNSFSGFLFRLLLHRSLVSKNKWEPELKRIAQTR